MMKSVSYGLLALGFVGAAVGAMPMRVAEGGVEKCVAGEFFTDAKEQEGSACGRLVLYRKLFPDGSKWIAYPYEQPMGNFVQKVLPAPTFRRAFTLEQPVADAILHL